MKKIINFQQNRIAVKVLQVFKNISTHAVKTMVWYNFLIVPSKQKIYFKTRKIITINTNQNVELNKTYISNKGIA